MDERSDWFSAPKYVPPVASATPWSVASSSDECTRKPLTSRVTPAALPMPTVSMRTPRSAASRAAWSGSGLSLFSPSLMSTMSAGACVPGGTGVGSGVGSGERLL